MNGPCPYKRDPESSPVPSAMWGHHEKMGISEPGGRPSPDTESAAPWSWACSLQNCEKWISAVYKLPSLWSFCYSSRSRLREKRFYNENEIIFCCVFTHTLSYPKKKKVSSLKANQYWNKWSTKIYHHQPNFFTPDVSQKQPIASQWQ